MKNLVFTDRELESIFEIIFALQSVKVTVDNLCARSINLYTADLTLQFMSEELQSQNSDLSIRLFDELIKQISKRRTIYPEVLQYLYNPSSLQSYKYDIFNISSKAEITQVL